MADSSTPMTSDTESDLEVTLVNADQELAALLAQVAVLSKLAVDMSERCIDLNDSLASKLALNVTRHCLDLNEQIPRVVRLKVNAALDEIRPHRVFFRGVAPTADELDAEFPTGRGDNQPWYVVWVGRQPGLFTTFEEANEQVDGVPGGARRRVVGRIPALAYYRQMYNSGKVIRLEEPAEAVEGTPDVV